MTASNFSDFCAACQVRLDRALQAALPPVNTRLHEAMHYAVFNGGKRLRALLVYSVANIFGEKNLEVFDRLAVAIESIHSYSLVHDDLPAMDDDALRRGKPSCHIAFDEATAILCGDALQCFAFEWLAKINLPPEKALQLITLLSEAVGSEGMALGQHYDLINRAATDAELITLHQLKTGRLISASVSMAYQALPNTDSRVSSHLAAYAEHLGLAYQICDDILDVTVSTERLGKPACSDVKNHKVTFVSFYGLAKAREKMHEEIIAANQQLAMVGLEGGYLSEIAELFINRKA